MWQARKDAKRRKGQYDEIMDVKMWASDKLDKKMGKTVHLISDIANKNWAKLNYEGGHGDGKRHQPTTDV
jgi:hypothetical protein